MDKIKVGIIGAGGYGGCGAVELLQAHPHAEIIALIDKQDVGKRISDLYPHLTGFCDLTLMDPDDPNCPDAVSTASVQFGEQSLDGQESCGAAVALRGFFCEAYTPSDPGEAIDR